METVISALSRYAFGIFIAFYAFNSFFASAVKEDERNGFYFLQNIFMVFIHVLGFYILSLEGDHDYYILLCLLQEVLFFTIIILYRTIYKGSSILIVNNMCLMLAVSLLMLTRLSFAKSLKQFVVVAISTIITAFIPFLMPKLKRLKSYNLIFGLGGLAVLLIVFIAGTVTNGSKISYSIGGITFQPSEFVKLTFIIFVAGVLAPEYNEDPFDYRPSVKQIAISAAVAAATVIVLVLSRDLGGALIFFVIYFAMLYVIVKNPLYLLGGAVIGALGSIAGYKLFSHVRTRVIAWRDPYSVIEGQGYQIAQSLFAIGTGGWIGMGLDKGTPTKIPVVAADFIFAAICEELGCVFGFCLVLIILSTFIMMMNAAMRIADHFYRLIIVGISVALSFQVLLNIGGVTKFIPMTGVTLPLISYGGSSVLVCMSMFASIQGIYMMIPAKKQKHQRGDRQ
ncbi:MAG: FtsW/RodA/SpoVE family cell cycle protein [Lachnospiraceae bacterium]|nr:FtsW/RodA/SpoVE family cell cycle protein [Lachnospiraceae bacterium]